MPGTEGLDDDSLIRFHTTIAKELESLKDRVRLLINNANWSEEGRYKEAILRGILRKYLPYPYKPATGFVIAKAGEISKQIDILIYDRRHPLYFAEGDFVISSALSFSGMIEVKTRARSIGDISSSLGYFSTRFFRGINLQRSSVPKFMGLFFYEFEVDIQESEEGLTSIKDSLASSGGVVNHIVLGPDVFIKLWDTNEYRIYKLEGLSYAYFLSNLYENLGQLSGLPFYDQAWFRFSIPGGKSSYEIGRVRVRANNNG